MEGRFKGIEGRINLLTGLIFLMLTLYGALVAKLIFFHKNLSNFLILKI